MKNFIRKNFIIILLFFVTIPAFWDIVRPGYFPMHDDLQPIRLLVMDNCFKDLQIPCRWSKEMGYGYGYPIFNYYPPFPFYLGQFFRIFNFQYIDITKILFILNFLISGYGMYLLAKEFWGRWGGFLSAVAFIYVPYRALDIYVRGAMNEIWAVSFFPYIFWSSYQLVKTNQSKYIIYLALSTAGLMLSHNLMLMIFAPAAIVWTVGWIYIFKNWKSFPKLVISALWSLGLASFFTLPVIFEQKYAHVESLIIGYFNYLAHFVSLEQLFLSNFWGYGASVLGTNDGMGYQIGFMHWLLGLLTLFTAFLLYKKQREVSLVIIFFVATSFFYIFMSHQKSSFIWEQLDFLHYLQFPWRFLAYPAFGLSFLIGSCALLFNYIQNRNFRIILVGFLAITLIAINIRYFVWEKHFPEVTDQHKFTGELWKLQVTAGIFDYLPKSANLPPGGPPKDSIEAIEGTFGFKTVVKKSNYQEYDIESKEKSILMLNTYTYPGWVYYINDKKVEPNKLDKELGRPQFNLDPGSYKFIAKFTDTPVRILGNLVSLISFSVFFIVIYKFYINSFRKIIKK